MSLPQLLAKASNPTGQILLPWTLEYNSATGYVTRTGKVGPASSILAELDAVAASGARSYRCEQMPGGLARLTFDYGTINKNNPNSPPDTETPEVVWEILGQNETVDLNRSDKGRALERLYPGVLKAIEATIARYKKTIDSEDFWTTNDTATKVNVAIEAARQKALDAIKTFGTDAEELFNYRMQGVEQFRFTSYALRKSVTLSSTRAAIASEVTSGTLKNADRFFTREQVIAVETTMPTWISGNMPPTFITSDGKTTEGYYLKHSPHATSSSTGRVTVSVEYQYTLDLCGYAYLPAENI